MKKAIFNENTLELSRQQTCLAFRECYLKLQHCLLTFLERADNPKDKEKYQSWIGEVGETYKRAISNM